MESLDKSRRKFLQKATYIAPTVLTLSAVPMIARAGSMQLSGSAGSHSHRGHGRCHGKSMAEDFKTSTREPEKTMVGEFGCTDLKNKLFFK